MVSVIILLCISFVCAYIHKNKGYSPIAGFLWGLCFSVIGLIVVLLEKDKIEHDEEMAKNNSLSLTQWILIFSGIGIVLIIILFMFIL